MTTSTAPSSSGEDYLSLIVPVPPIGSPVVAYLAKAGAALRPWLVRVAEVYGDLVSCGRHRRGSTTAATLRRADAVLSGLVARDLDRADVRPGPIAAALDLAAELVRHATQADDLATLGAVTR